MMFGNSTIFSLKTWVVNQPDKDIVEIFIRELGVSRPAATVLVNRGITTVEEARGFLTPELGDLANPFLLPDMEKAVARIRKAIENKEKILVYGDRDVDGVSSICVIVQTLRSLGAEPVWYIPSDEGYGLHKEIIERYVVQGITLMITVDCGISALEETAYAVSRGIDVVITDHHEPLPAGLPQALAVVDPKRAASSYPYTEIAGCLVSFKVAEALMSSFGKYFDEEMVVLDFETTGLELGNAEICEAGAVKIKNGLVIETFQSLARPERGIKPEISAIHGITNEMVARAPSVGEMLRKLIEFIGKRRLIIHNAEFDLGFLRFYAKRYLDADIDNPYIDTLSLSRKNFIFDSYALPALVKSMKIKRDKFHRALDDAMAAYEVFLRIEQYSDIRMKFFRENHLDVLALGTIADIMPLSGENRIIVKHGLKALLQSRKPGVKALVERCSGNRNSGMTGKFVSWSITPVLNAAGRRGRADLAAELLLCEDPYRADELMDAIIKLNGERKELQAENMEKFLPLMLEQCDVEKDRIFVVTASGVEHGVTGIIASQLARQYSRPVILLILEDGEAMGAARSIEGFDIVAALDKTRDLLVKYGGHAQAAGLTVKKENIEEFRARITKIAGEEITPERMVPEIKIDCELSASEATMGLVEELGAIEPFGAGNPNPVFALREMRVLERARMGDNHLKLRIAKNGNHSLTAVGWGMGRLLEDIDNIPLVDLAFQLEINNWKDKKTLQLMIVDVKPSEI
ncbi:MAG: single-stranded-DNA-specific exonuclease RecJ [Elusimicrobiota bacterium]